NNCMPRSARGDPRSGPSTLSHHERCRAGEDEGWLRGPGVDGAPHGPQHPEGGLPAHRVEPDGGQGGPARGGRGPAGPAGARGGAAEVARRSEVVGAIVTDGSDVEAVVGGEDGVLAGAGSGLVWIDMSTISPEVTRRLGAAAAEIGAAALDAPVSGGPPGAET